MVEVTSHERGSEATSAIESGNNGLEVPLPTSRVIQLPFTAICFQCHVFSSSKLLLALSVLPTL